MKRSHQKLLRCLCAQSGNLRAWHASPDAAGAGSVSLQGWRFSSSWSTKREPLESLAGGGIVTSARVGGREVVFETGRLARLAGGACVVRCGGTAVLATACLDPTPRPDVDSTPLQVDYRERMYAAGRIPGRPDRREPGAGSEHELLAARAIDRALRPLFPSGFLYDTQVVALVLSADGCVDPEVLAVNAASAALALSDVPWAGPVGAVKVGELGGGGLTVNPSALESGELRFGLTLAGTLARVTMLEAGGSEVADEGFAAALRLAHHHAGCLVAPQAELLARGAGHAKRRLPLLGPPAALQRAVDELGEAAFMRVFGGCGGGGDGSPGGLADKGARAAAITAAQREVLAGLVARGLLPDAHSHPAAAADGRQYSEAQARAALDVLQSRVMRHLVLTQGVRLDGRTPGELRAVAAAAGLLPRAVHGSALFERGDTQCMAAATVGPDRAAPTAEGLAGTATKQLALHYSFPPFCNGEVGRMGPPGRRELGHGALAERALAPLMPPADDFPFVVRLAAETLASSGSSSMAAVCAGSMAMRCAGVPISGLAAGISIGLAAQRFAPPAGGVLSADAASSSSSSDAAEGGDPFTFFGRPLVDCLAAEGAGGGGGGGDGAAPAAAVDLLGCSYGAAALLTDIQGAEDHLGDMDFKVAGTRGGITAAQLDTKLPGGADPELLVAALGPAAAARGALLDAMEAEVAEWEARTPAAQRPVVGSLEINRELVPRLVGLQGSNLTAIEERTGGRLIVADTGEVALYAPTASRYEHALAATQEVEGLSYKAGQVFPVKVLRVVDFGAFVELPNGLPTLLHISQLSHVRLRDVHELLREGQVFDVMCKGRNAKGMVELSRKDLLPRPRGGGGGKRKAADKADKAEGEAAEGTAQPAPAGGAAGQADSSSSSPAAAPATAGGPAAEP